MFFGGKLCFPYVIINTNQSNLIFLEYSLASTSFCLRPPSHLYNLGLYAPQTPVGVVDHGFTCFRGQALFFLCNIKHKSIKLFSIVLPA